MYAFNDCGKIRAQRDSQEIKNKTYPTLTHSHNNNNYIILIILIRDDVMISHQEHCSKYSVNARV